MKPTTRRIASILPAALIALAPLASAHTRITTDVNWGKDIRPILEEKCMSCHHPGGMAPDYVNLTIYGDDTNPGARAWAVAIEEEVLTDRMPPWQADARFGKFDSSKHLTELEVDTIIAWVRGGSPQGPIRNLPMPEQFEKPDWAFGEPDVVVAPEKPYTLKADEQFGTVTYTVPVELEEETYVTGYEFLVENPKNIHSITAWLNDAEGAELAPLELEVQGEYDPLADEDDLETTRMREMPAGPHLIGQWVQGDDPVLFPDAAGRLFRTDSTVTVTIQYARPEYADWSTDVIDSSKLGLFVAQPDEEIDLLVESIQLTEDDFEIKAGDAEAEVTTSLTIEEAILLIGLRPELGPVPKNYEMRLTYPDGRTSTLIWLPKLAQKWESSYRFAKPIEAPVGSKIDIIAKYDNSEDNWDNPNSPPIALAAGNGFREAKMRTTIDYMLNDHLKVEEVFVPRERPAAELEGTGMSIASTPAFPGFDPGNPDPKGGTLPEDDSNETIMKDLVDSVALDDDHIFWCPMRGNPCALTDYTEPGICDDCFMNLKPKSFFMEGQELAPTAHDWELSKTGKTDIYWCVNRGDEDHQQIDYFAPGDCDICSEPFGHQTQFEVVHTYACMIPDCENYQKIYYGPGLCSGCGQPVSGLGHMDHTPMHGGWQFFMVDNLYHHLEGTMHKEGIFKLYMYDDWKVPLDTRFTKATLFVEQEDEATGDVTTTEYELSSRKDGDTWFTADLPKEFPIDFYVHIWLPSVDDRYVLDRKRYDFTFEELTPLPDPNAVPTGEFQLHAHQCQKFVVPPTVSRIVQEIVKQDRMIATYIETADWLKIHCPAADTKTLVEALSDQASGLNVRQRGTLKKIQKLVGLSSLALDRAGDVGDIPRVNKAYKQYSEAMTLLGQLYPDTVQQ
ncbi:MAG: hypothetical protein VCD00_03100 [Candidatus Hydrogenedentota bacterium]